MFSHSSVDRASYHATFKYRKARKKNGISKLKFKETATNILKGKVAFDSSYTVEQFDFIHILSSL